MSYRDLYDYCQAQNVPVSRRLIRPKIKELLPEARVQVIVSTLDRDAAHGYYVSAENDDHPFVRMTGGKTVIVLSRSLNHCWSRFVEVKELMHLFDGPLQTTNGGEELEALLLDFCGLSSGPMTQQMLSEIDCFWMAMGLVCPEHVRVEYLRKRDAGHISDRQIAGELLIPEAYIPHLFHVRFKDHIARVLDKKIAA